MRPTDVVIVIGFNAQMDGLAETERGFEDRFCIPAVGTGEKDRLVQVSSDYRLFLVNTNFRREKRYRLTWLPPSPSQRYISVGSCFCLRLICGRTSMKTTHPGQLLVNENQRHEFSSELSMRILSQPEASGPTVS